MNVVVTGGGTIAPIDDVRSITNGSSGTTSAMISEACLRRGANVWHIHSPSARLPFFRSASFDLDTSAPEAEHARLEKLRRDHRECADRLHLVPIGRGTVAEYSHGLRRVLEEHAIDVAFLAMAVSDFEPDPVAGKLESAAESLVIRAKRVPKIIQSVRGWSPRVYLVGFKLLSRVSAEDLIREAELACETNRADVMVANDLQTLIAGRHIMHLVRPGCQAITVGPGWDAAERVVEHVFQWASCRGGRSEAHSR
jgi:phosphopantothenate-cysteine ligase